MNRAKELARRALQTDHGKKAVARLAAMSQVGPAPVAETPVESATPEPPAERPRPIPSGWTEAEVRAAMHSFSVSGSAPGDLDHYVNDSFGRFLHTWGLVASGDGRALELGANPYFTTWLLNEFTNLDLTLANFFGADRGEVHQPLIYTDRDGTRVERTYTSQLFNLEEEAFPYADESFDVVLFCEIIEHLLVDPLRALREIHRVMKPGGQLIVTTPNVARLGNVLSLVAGENLYDPYSGFGPYGRHNREFTQHELANLLAFAGFEVTVAFTANAHPDDLSSRQGYGEVLSLVDFRRADLGQYLFMSATKARPGRKGFPSWLYRSLPDGQIVD